MSEINSIVTIEWLSAAAESGEYGAKRVLKAGWRRVAGFARMFMAMLTGGSAADVSVRFNRLVADYGDMISGICFSFASDGDEFKDLRQDALLNLWRGLSQFREASGLSTWVYRVTMNTCVSSYRRRTRVGRKVSLSEVGELADAPDETRERVEYLHTLIGHLGAVDRSIVLMWLDERSYDEIAQVMGMNRNTVATRLRRIREKLTKVAENN